MSDIKLYDAIVVVTPKDFKRVESNNKRIVEYLPVRKVLFVGSKELGELVEQSSFGDKAGFVDENDIIPFDDVYNCLKDVMADILLGRELPRGLVGWYYQQFLKLQYARMCKDEYYMSWDGDTVPCKNFSMFSDDGRPYFDLKHEFHQEYFITMNKLLPNLDKTIDKSFISEHMIFNCKYLVKMLEDIESNENIEGVTFWEKILHSIRLEHIQENSFSEFETFDTYMTINYPDVYNYRDWHSFRYGGYFFHPEAMTQRDYSWLAKDFFAISFEKSHSVREDHENLFNNPVYQSKLTARQMVEIAQEEAEEGYEEVWD